MVLPERVTLIEVGPRDGFQSEQKLIPTDLKVELIDGLADAGLTEIQVCSFVNPARVPQMADAEDVVKRVATRPGVTYSGLALNVRGVERAAAAGLGAVDLSISTSDTHSRKNANRSLLEARADVRAHDPRRDVEGPEDARGPPVRLRMRVRGRRSARPRRRDVAGDRGGRRRRALPRRLDGNGEPEAGRGRPRARAARRRNGPPRASPSRHARPRPVESSRRSCRPASRASTPGSGVSAAARSFRARPATSRRRTP